jgi:hypothetical protein
MRASLSNFQRAAAVGNGSGHGQRTTQAAMVTVHRVSA